MPAQFEHLKRAGDRGPVLVASPLSCEFVTVDVCAGEYKALRLSPTNTSLVQLQIPGSLKDVCNSARTADLSTREE